MKYIIILTAIVLVLLYYGIGELLCQLKNPAVRMRFKKLAIGVLIAALLASQIDIMSLFTGTAYAAEAENSEIIKVSAFAGLPDDIKVQSVSVGTALYELKLPDTLEAVVVTDVWTDTNTDANEGEDTDTSGGTDTDADIDSDTDTDEDTNVGDDADVIVDADTDKESHVDPDVDTDTDTDIDTGNDADTNADTYTDTDVTPDNDMLGDIDDIEGDIEKVETFSVTMPEYQAGNVIEVKTLEMDSAANYGSMEETIIIKNITWQSEPEYDGDTEGEYVFTAVLPEGYALTGGVNTPQITVTVGGTDDTALLSGDGSHADSGAYT